MPEAHRLNDFILTGKGNPEGLIKGMYFWTWNTHEVLDLVLWMREFNRSGKGHIEFTGFDMQNPTMAMTILIDFVLLHNPELLTSAQHLREHIQLVGSLHSSPQVADFKQLATESESLEKQLAISSVNPVPKDIGWAMQMARIVHQWASMQGGEKTRDECMADNVKWIAGNSPKSKIILWAHNGHVTYDGDSYVPMGAYLKRYFGPQLVSFGFVFDHGSFRALGEGNRPTSFEIGPAPDGSLDHALASIGSPLFALDLRGLAPDTSAGKWASEPHPSRSIGAVFRGPDDPSTIVEVPITKRFDAILFVNETSPSIPIAPSAKKRYIAGVN